MEGETRRRRRVCSATCTRWATARAAAWPIAARVCQKNCPRWNLKASSLGSSLLCRLNQLTVRWAPHDDVEEAQELAVEAPAGGDDAGQEGVIDSGISGPVAVHGASGALEELRVYY